MADTINFYSSNGAYGCFSNFSRHPVKIWKETYPTSEHAFQAAKFAGTKYAADVRKPKAPAEAARLGRDRSLPLRKDWESVKVGIMKEVLVAKFSQHEGLKKTLLETADATLVEHTDRDAYWGDGGNGKGKNMLGRLLMEVRA